MSDVPDIDAIKEKVRNARYPETPASWVVSDAEVRFMVDKIERQEAEIEELKVRDICARNPGIDADEVRKTRARLAKNRD